MRGDDARLLQKQKVRTLFAFLLKHVDAITTVAEHQRQLLREILPTHASILCIPNGCDNVEKIEEIDIQQINELIPEKTLVCIGRIIPEKGQHLLIKFMKSPDLLPYTLVLCGRVDDEYREKIEKQIISENLESRVVLLPPIKPTQVRALLRKGAVFLTASTHNEGRPNVVLEAMSEKIPVVASRIPAHEELIVDGNNGGLFDPEDQEQFIKAIKKVVLNREKIISEGLRTVENLSWERSAKAYQTLYQQLVYHPESSSTRAC